MNEPTLPHEELPRHLTEFVSRACDAFETAWQTGQEPPLEPYLGQVVEPARTALLRRLLVLDLIYRRQAGQHPTPEDYTRRFPEHAEMIGNLVLAVGPSPEGPGGTAGLLTGREAVTASEGSPLRCDPADVDLGEEDFPSRSLDHLQRRERIGKGGMGVVHRAWDPDLARDVALKCIRHGESANRRDVLRFFREARVVARFHHPNIIPIYDFGVYQGEPAFTMPLLTGGTLADHAARYRDPRAAVALIEIVARAVHHAHKAGVVHRDLKPGNIFFDQAGEPLVGDFGLAKLLEPDAELTSSGGLVGTPAYMAPEQFPDHATEITAQTDVWALGVILWELLTGTRPFPGPSWKDYSRQVVARPRPFDAQQTNLDPALASVLRACLDRDSPAPYPSAGDLADDLARWLRGEQTHAPPAPPPQPEPTGRKRGQSGPIVLAILAALGLIWASWAIYHRLVVSEDPGPKTGDEDRWERDLLAGLRRDGRVTLVGGGGTPAGSRWIFGEKTSKVQAEPDEPLWVSSGDFCLLELLSRVPADAFELSAEVKQDTSAHGVCEVGIFCCHTILEGGDEKRPAPTRALVKLTFNEFQTHLEDGQKKSWLYWQPVLFDRLDQPTANPAGGQKKKIDPAPGRWRRLVATVGPQGVEGKFGDVSLMKHPWEELPRRLAMPDAPAVLNGQGGVGIFLRLGAASFRNIEIVTPPARRE